MEAIPKFLQGVFSFTGAGLDRPSLLDPKCVYTVSSEHRSQLVYLRAGNSSGELICLTLMRDGKVMRLFPIGAKSGEHIPLAVVEDLEPTTKLEVYVAAPEGVSGYVVLDIAALEI